MVAEILKKCIDVAPRIVFLFVDGLAMEFIDKVQGSFPELIAPSPSVLPPSQAGLISRKISVTSSCVETATAPASTAVLDHDSIVHLESKGVGHTSKYVSLPETVKVSIWLQVTVPKLSLDVINNDAGQGRYY